MRAHPSPSPLGVPPCQRHGPTADFEAFWILYCRTAESKSFSREPRPLVVTLIGVMLFWMAAYLVYRICAFELCAETPSTGNLTLWKVIRHFRGRPLCMTRDWCGSLLLHRNGFAPSISCRSPDAPQ